VSGRYWARTKLTPARPDSTEGESAGDLQGKDGESAEGDDRLRLTENNPALGQHADKDEPRRAGDLPFIHDGQLSIFDLPDEGD
jgi:hypothetical protein